jgi:ribulose-phosphate 3-epimerase
MEKENLVRPSLLSADFNHLGNDIEECISLGISHIHYDVMDGTFVDDISFGEPVFGKVNQAYGNQVTFDVHLMTFTPLKQVELFARIGVKEICFHYEMLTLGDIPRLREVRSKYPELMIGIAFSPETQVEELKDILSFFDYVLVMSVVPGKGGQKFIPGSEDKVAWLNHFRKEANLSYTIGVDGGINEVTGPLCTRNGADFLVAGSYYFKSKDKKACLALLHQD